MESSLFLNWACNFALTLLILLASEPACIPLQVVSQFSFSFFPPPPHEWPSSLPCGIPNALLLPFPPLGQYLLLSPCFLLCSLMVEPSTSGLISVLTGRVNQACTSRRCVTCISFLYGKKHWIILISSLI